MSLFHYTDANAVMKILEKQTLWLTNIQFLNDNTEYSHGIGKFLNPNTTTEQKPSSREARLKQHYDKIIKLIINLGERNLGVCSFSNAGDLLSQWRGYGRYAIEFDKKILDDFLPGLLFECYYDEKEQEILAKDAKEILITKLAGERDALNAAIHYVPTVWPLIATFKNEGFYEEKEWRLIKTKDEKDKYKFRVRNGILIPYFEIEFPVEAIKRVWIGPMQNQELSKASVEMLLKSLKQDIDNKFSKIDVLPEVKLSPISFRG